MESNPRSFEFIANALLSEILGQLESAEIFSNLNCNAVALPYKVDSNNLHETNVYIYINSLWYR